MFRTFLNDTKLTTPDIKCKNCGLIHTDECGAIPLKDWEHVECEESGTVFYKHKHTQEIKWEHPTKSIS